MIKLLVTALALGVVLADGDFGGYHYNVPHTSYGVPSYQVSGNVASYNKNNYQSTAQLGSGIGQQSTGYYSGVSSSSYPTQTAGVGYTTGGNYQTLQSTGSLHGNGVATGAQYAGNFGTNQQAGLGSTGSQYSSTGSQYSSSVGSGNQNSYSGAQVSVPTASVLYTAPAQSSYSAYNKYQETSAVNKYQEQYTQVQQQPAQVFKHFYVHAAPEEPETPAFRQPIVVPPAQKHYQIIFIKTPTQKSVAPQYIPAPQKEEKTLVYVLVNKPEEQQQVVVPKVAPTKPNKPEVFFIKYNNKEGSQAVINNIVNDYNKGSNAVSVSGDAVYSGQQTGAISSGQYTQTTGNDQYVTSVGTDGSQNVGNSGQYALSSGSEIGSGQYSQGESSQSTGSGHYAGSSGTYSQSSGVEQYGTPLTDTFGGSQTFSQVSVSQGGSLASSGSSSDEQALNVASSDSGLSSSGAFSSGNAVGSSVSYDTQAGSSQGLPHETYGVPNFRA